MSAKELYWQSRARIRKFARYVNNKAKPFYCPLQQRNNHGVYAVYIDAGVGFFAQLTWCLYIFTHCEQFNLKPSIFLAGPFYTRHKGENWLEYYFDSFKLTQTDKVLADNRSVKYSCISDIGQMGMPVDYDKQMTLEQANRLLVDNLRIKTEIQDYVASFVEKHFAQKTVLGVHYRGTDKKSEAKAVSYEYVARTISNYLNANQNVDAIFVASDEMDVIEWIKSKFNHLSVMFHDDLERSRGGKPIHTNSRQGDNYIKGKEALVNCLLLSKCDALIRTASFLSAWSSIFNPDLPVIMLNRPFEDKLWFPDAEIIKKSLSEYLPSSI
jgi:hypothetical protein